MKRLLGLLTLGWICIFSHAQLSEGGKPYSYGLPELKNSAPIESIELRSLNFDNLIQKDAREGIDNRYGIVKKVNIDIRKEGSKTELDHGQIWRLEVKSPNALSIAIVFKEYKIPEGASVFVYSGDRKQLYGAFTNKNNKDGGSFAIADIFSNELTIEYYEPKTAEFPGQLIAGKLIQGYREIFEKNGYGRDIGINCIEGDQYQLHKHAVAKMTYGGYLCTGALINNTETPGIPYFLTANHCLSSTSLASDLNTWWNYELTSCNENEELKWQTLTGSSLKATHPETDFTLLQLDETPTPEMQPYYAGWNIEYDTIVPGAFGIHHPGGAVKKVAIEYDNVLNWPLEINWGAGNPVSPPNTHWLLFYNEGFTTGGSSGSPLFDNEGHIVGQLHGGSDENGNDFYGKISESWERGALLIEQLKYHLDPQNTGATKLDGYIPPTNTIDAHPYAEFTDVCQGESVALKNGTLFGATTYEWSFSPETVEYLDGTDSSFFEPVVRFLDAAAYSVTLIASNSEDADTVTRDFYISSGNNLEPKIIPLGDTLFCYNAIDTIKALPSRAGSYEWSISQGDEFMSFDAGLANGDTVVIVPNSLAVYDTSKQVHIQLKGHHGACSDSTQHVIYIEYRSNDNIENAIAIDLGQNGPYNNRCASTQENEPRPPHGSGDNNTCTDEGYWCACEVSEDILENSVWFTFVGPESGVAAIDANGFDSQIAVYEAESAADILSGNAELYTIIGAIDDNSGADFNATIEEITVTAGKTYWLQVDGSGCGASGEFNLTLYDESLKQNTSVDEIEETKVESFVYPVPVQNKFTINLPAQGEVKVSITSVSGAIVKEYNTYLDSAGKQELELPSGVENGLYIIRATTGTKEFSQVISVLK